MKFICIGRNYADHIEELGNERPENPVIFMKPDTSLLKDNAPFYHPDFSSDVHHEVEVLVKIKKEGKSISAAFAKDYYDQIGLGIDFTARDIQANLKSKGLPWERAKAFNQAAVVSSFVDKQDFDLTNLSFSLLKNDKEVQNGNTSLMLWPIDELISYVSHYFTLKTGDVLFTGTPKGVGPVKIGDQLVGLLADREMFRFDVK